MLAFITLVSFICLAVFQCQVDAARECNVTYTPTYQYGCRERGWVQKPAVISRATNPTAQSCAADCLSSSRCKSFRYIKSTTTCILYSRYLADMDTDFTNYQEGVLYERECYSTNCNVIEACAASKKCKDITTDYSFYYSLTWTEYACSYGHKARRYDHTSTTSTLPGTLAVCDAWKKCIGSFGHDGSYDIHYDLTKNEWVCISYNDGSNGYRDYATAQTQNITRHRYTVLDKTVGAGYGLWLADASYYGT